MAAARAALDAGFTKYTANSGMADLRLAVGHRYREDYGVEYAPDEVIITAGGKQALYHAAMALFGPGDEVITHLPGWPTIAEQVKLAGATPVLVHTRAANGFRAHRRSVALGRHPAHARHRAQLAVEPDRCAHDGGRGRASSVRRRTAAASGSSSISATTGSSMTACRITCRRSSANAREIGWCSAGRSRRPMR